MDVLFVAAFSPIARDVSASREFYAEGLGVELEGGEGEYRFTERLDGIRHLGVWPLEEAAQACFGTSEWPEGVTVPQATIEFEVADVDAAATELQAKGYTLVHAARTEPWTQRIARLLSPEGLLVGVCYTPWFHTDSSG